MKQKRIEYLQMMLDLFPDSGFENYATIEDIEDEKLTSEYAMFRILYKLGNVEVVQNEDPNIRTMCHGLMMGFKIIFDGSFFRISVIGNRYKVSNVHVRGNYFHSHLERHYDSGSTGFCINKSNLEGYLSARYITEIKRFIQGEDVDVNMLNQSLKSYLIQISKLESRVGVPYKYIEHLTNDQNSINSFSNSSCNDIIKMLANEECVFNWKFKPRVGFQLQNDTTLDNVLSTMSNKLGETNPDHSWLRKADALGKPINVISPSRWLTTEENVIDYVRANNISMRYQFKGEYNNREIIILPYEQQPVVSYVFADPEVGEKITTIINNKMNKEDEQIKF